MLTEAGTNTEGSPNPPSAAEHLRAPSLGDSSCSAPWPGSLTAQRLHLELGPPPQEGSVSLKVLVGLQLADVALLVLIRLTDIPLEEGARRSCETPLTWRGPVASPCPTCLGLSRMVPRSYCSSSTCIPPGMETSLPNSKFTEDHREGLPSNQLEPACLWLSQLVRPDDCRGG